jgi:rRNA maturation endonuclease Nob1
MIGTDREVVFVCRSCGASSASPRTPINICPDCGGRVGLRYADRVEAEAETGADLRGSDRGDG